MMITLVKLGAARKVINQWETDKIPLSLLTGTGKLRANFLDVTGHQDGPDFFDRTHNETTDRFSAAVVIPETRRQVLADKEIWGQNDRDEALRIWLDPSKGV